MEKFRNKYRIQSARLSKWDYCCSASYYITICTAQRENYFGKIENDEMVLSQIGKIAEQEWIKTPKIRPDMNLELGAFVVMPNHFHAIINIGENDYNFNFYHDENNCGDKDGVHHGDDAPRRDAMHCVSTTSTAKINASNVFTQPNKNLHTKNQFGPQSKNLGAIIRGYKSAVTTYARKYHIEFGWQPRFYDRIIRDNDEFSRIQQYIQNNPINWVGDENYK